MGLFPVEPVAVSSETVGGWAKLGSSISMAKKLCQGIKEKTKHHGSKLSSCDALAASKARNYSEVQREYSSVASAGLCKAALLTHCWPPLSYGDLCPKIPPSYVAMPIFCPVLGVHSLGGSGRLCQGPWRSVYDCLIYFCPACPRYDRCRIPRDLGLCFYSLRIHIVFLCGTHARLLI